MQNPVPSPLLGKRPELKEKIDRARGEPHRPFVRVWALVPEIEKAEARV